MLAKVHSFILIGIDPLLCEVEVDVSQRGLSKTVIVGLAQTAVKESIERVRRAMINSGYAFPSHALPQPLADLLLRPSCHSRARLLRSPPRTRGDAMALPCL